MLRLIQGNYQGGGWQEVEHVLNILSLGMKHESRRCPSDMGKCAGIVIFKPQALFFRSLDDNPIYLDHVVKDALSLAWTINTRCFREKLKKKAKQPAPK